ncbi:cytochrome P450 [Ganoderma sinense ZZ0214-1]|uniref:Cytochrome P450 n=1 Tax=Ganoderma sinense ZZ0214-1 TaxID=1077348 RepID=A0A2G8S905_9APHY|nr:cytochrome P450 [Ganoderma sinense ZZ0214-1]
MDDLQPTVLALVAVVIVIYAVRWYTDPRLQGDASLQYPDSAFKIATLDRWLVVFSGRRMVEELRKRPDDELSGPHGTWKDRYHTDIAREKLLKKLYSVLPDAIDEIFVAIKDNVPTQDKEWTRIEVMPAVAQILARASNRIFVGLPLCRDEAYLQLVLVFPGSLVKEAGILRRVPNVLKRALEEFGEDWDNKPNDALQWIVEKAIPRGETASTITQRLFVFNFAAIGTSSNIMAHALYRLAENPDLVGALREEVQACISDDGWTGTALGRMWKLDSLLRETMLTMTRKALKDVTLHDGTRVPAGTLLSANAYPLHHDAAPLADSDARADTFDPLRYARMRSGAGQSLRHQLTSTSPEYIPFGHGPGRFFAANILKATLARILLDYDVKLAPGPRRLRFADRHAAHADWSCPL